VFGWRSSQKADHRSPPQTGSVLVFVLVAEDGFHFFSVFALEIERKQPQQKSIQPT
jgi:hypothetical protein